MEKVLITGANGFVGSFLVEECLNRKIEVYAAVRSTSNLQFLTDPRIKFVYIDFEDSAALARILKLHQFEYIIHTAGATGGIDKNIFYKVNTGYSNLLIKATLKNIPALKKFIFISSLASKGPADYTKDTEINDTSLAHPVTHYGKSKLLTEEYLITLKALPYLIVRPTAVFGPRDKEFLPLFKMVSKGISLRANVPEQELSFIFIRDLSRIVADMMLSSIQQKAYCLSDGNVYKTKTFTEILAKALNKNIISLRIPVNLLKMVGFINQETAKVTGRNPLLNLDKVKELSAKSWNCSIRELQNDFNFQPNFSLDTAISETLQWYRENKWL